MQKSLQDQKLNDLFLFLESGIGALNKIGGYGKAEFTCPLCGGSATISKMHHSTSSRNGAYLKCDQCGHRIIS